MKKNLLTATIVACFSYSAFAAHHHSMCCGYQKDKYESYTSKKVKWDRKFEECKETATDSTTCYWEIKKKAFYANKVEKWSNKLRQCKKLHEEIFRD